MAVQFEYDKIMKRHNVRVPFSLAGEKDMATVASITEDDKLILHREIGLNLVQQILMHWTEYCHQLEMKDKREQEEFNQLIEGDK